MNRSSASKLIILIFISLVFSLLPLTLTQTPQMTFSHHSIQLNLLSWSLLAGLFFLGLSGYYLLTNRFFTAIYTLPSQRARQLELLSYAVLLLAPLCFLSLKHYLTATDLYSRLKLFLIFLVGGVFWIKIIFLTRLEKKQAFLSSLLPQVWTKLSLKKKTLILFLVALIIYNIGSFALISRGMVFSGDEPHYLIITHSLLQDGDINLKNNYTAQDYRVYMRPYVTIDPHTAPNTQGRYSFHSPGVSFLALPFYSLGYILKGKWLHFLTRMAMTLWAALFGIQIYLFLAALKFKEKTALLSWFIFSFTSPVFFYSFHLYPEIPAALISFYVFRKLYFLSSPKPEKLLLLGLLTSSLIWFHSLKYLFIMGPLFLYGSWVIFRKTSRKSSWLFFLLGNGVMASIYLFFQYHFYKSLSLSAVSWRGAVNFNESFNYLKFLLAGIPFHYRWETFLGYFLDQRDGLLFYSPVYLFAFLGLIALGRRNPRFMFLLLSLTTPYLLVSAWLTQRTGYAPQARPLVAVSWTLALWLAFYIQSPPKKVVASGFKICLFLSLIFPFLQLKHPYSLYQLTTQGETQRAGELFLYLSNMHFELSNYLPSFLKIDNRHWWPNWLWLGLLILVAFLYPYLPSRKEPSLKPALTTLSISLVITGLFFWFVYYPRTPLGNPQVVTFPSGERIFFYPYSRVARQEKPGRFKLLEVNRDYVFYFSSVRPITLLQLEIGSPRANYRVAIDYFDEAIFQGETGRSFRKIELKNPLSYKYKKGLHLYRIRVAIWARQPLKQPPPCWFQILPSAQTS